MAKVSECSTLQPSPNPGPILTLNIGNESSICDSVLWLWSMIGAVCIVSHEQTQSDIYRTCDIVIWTKRHLLDSNNTGADKFTLP